jgi:hypothetical protein
MVEANAESRVSLRLQREETTKFASSLARAKEAHALDIEVKSWFERTKSYLGHANGQTLLTDFAIE